MNILPKKSWHVLSRDNLEKVRKDEAEAKRIEDDKARRAALAEQEAKINFMRKRARDDQVKGQYEDIIRDTSQVSETSSDHTTGHFNFFADMKSGIGLKGSMNAEHEVEKKQDQEKWEKKVGILTYLVDKDDGSSAPWYLKKEKKEKR
jgi:N-methylhydantoinase B/oxoprolinase/acetone carboxylase alpha subunit